VLDQKVGLLLAPAPVQGKVNIELYRVYARESVRQFPGPVESPARIAVVGIGRHHQEHVGPFPHGLQLQIVPQPFRRHPDIGGGQLFAKVALVGLKTASEGECVADIFSFTKVTKLLRDLEGLLLRNPLNTVRFRV